ncbi:hypothetical protein BMF94_2363 [Rhodotorula taiwanensis]|uniref:Uncharacterized protein n=1 Tax=Rhodotorula taiwanensis TaxID=741276 RepID=A0A2S5BCW1_9BASI|nr:hypothetical protein BMF94_2363 [Rhodotorula taiwanensis]
MAPTRAVRRLRAGSNASTLEITTTTPEPVKPPALRHRPSPSAPALALRGLINQLSVRRRSSPRKRRSRDLVSDSKLALPPKRNSDSPRGGGPRLTPANLARRALIAAEELGTSWREHKGAVLVECWRLEVQEEIEREKALLRPVSTTFVRSFKVASLVLPPETPHRSPLGSADIWLDSATPSPDALQAVVRTAFVANTAIPTSTAALLADASRSPTILPYYSQGGVLSPVYPSRAQPDRAAATKAGARGESAQALPQLVFPAPFKVEPPPRKTSLPFSNLLPGSPLPPSRMEVPAKAAAVLGFDVSRVASDAPPRSAFAASDTSVACQPSRPTTRTFTPRPTRQQDDSRSVAGSSSSSLVSSLFSNSTVGRFLQTGGRPSFSSFSTPPSAAPSTSFESRRRPFATRKTPPAPLSLSKPALVPAQPVRNIRRSKSSPAPRTPGIGGRNNEDEETESLADVLDPAMSRWNRGGRKADPSASGPITALVRKMSQGKLTRGLSGRRRQHTRAATTAT